VYGILASTFGPSIDSPSASTPPEIPMGDLSGYFIQVIITLAVIIGLIVVLIRFLAAKNKRWSGERMLRVHAGVALGQHKSLQIVEIGDAVYIVGVGENITLLDKIEDPERADTLLASLEPKHGASTGAAFMTVAQIIGRFRKRSKTVPEDETRHSNEQFRDLLHQKLKGIGSRKEAMEHWLKEDPTERRSEEGR
jgi:flagellar protein FliO/FliZ